ncbi:hypothetical protein OK016_00045 [Vibrio chagasii]|nr:hypothetical protein [Vibrio chagasii]
MLLLGLSPSSPVAARCISDSRGSRIAAYVYIITCWNRRGS